MVPGDSFELPLIEPDLIGTEIQRSGIKSSDKVNNEEEEERGEEKNVKDRTLNGWMDGWLGMIRVRFTRRGKPGKQIGWYYR